MNKFSFDSFNERINDNHREEEGLTTRDSDLHNLLLRPRLELLDQSRRPLSWHLKQQLLQEQHNSLRTKLLSAIYNPIVPSLDSNSSLLSERRLMLRTHAVTTLSYRQALQHIHDQESLFLTQFSRNTNTASNPFTENSRRTIPPENNTQHYTSLVNNKNMVKHEESSPDPSTNTRSQRDPAHSFPCQLHEILSNQQYSECITWLPNGRAWKILRRTQFERIVIPRHFRHGKYSSFMRQVRKSLIFGHECFQYHNWFVSFE
jgi:HSF-type DNA-binding